MNSVVEKVHSTYWTLLHAQMIKRISFFEVLCLIWSGMKVCNLLGRDISIAATYRLPEAHRGLMTQWCLGVQTSLLWHIPTLRRYCLLLFFPCRFWGTKVLHFFPIHPFSIFHHVSFISLPTLRIDKKLNFQPILWALINIVHQTFSWMLSLLFLILWGKNLICTGAIIYSSYIFPGRQAIALLSVS